jgi:hypothetical protein
MKRGLIFLFLCLATAACRNGAPNNVLNEETYTDLMVELQLLKSYQQKAELDSLSADSIRREIFEKYETSDQQFQKSHRYYRQDVENQSKRISTAIEKLRKDRLGPEDSTATIDSTASK